MADLVLKVMSRRLRFIPDGGALVEVTCRTLQGRFLLKPTPDLRSVIFGILGRAQRLYPVDVHAFVFLSNHYHLLLSVKDARRLAQFMNYLNSNLAREAGRLHGWEGRFWSRRYQAIVVSEQEAAQVDRLRYLLSHGCKEGLVARPQDWPGAHCARSLIGEDRPEGLWFDRTREYSARARGERCSRLQYATRVRLRLEFLPCWSHLSRSGYEERIRKLLAQIEEESSVRLQVEGARPAGVARVLSQNPHARPHRLKKVQAPAFHAATKAARRELLDGYRWFVDAYRRAAEKLRRGERGVAFPAGCFPPRLPFVEWTSGLKPG